MPLPMRMNSPSRMVFSGVIVGMRVYKGSAQASGQYGHRERHAEYFSHDALIVRDPAHGVKAAGNGTIAAVRGWQSGRSPQHRSASSRRTTARMDGLGRRIDAPAWS